jgi:LysM repeat protein
MQEAARLARNTQRLGECYPPFGAVLRNVLDDMQAQGFRPRIQDGWRSEADQLSAFKKGTSKVKFGFHNVTGAAGAKESLACDVLDDDQPVASRTGYLLALTIASRAHGLDTGILWDLKAADEAPVEAALAAKNLNAPVRLGFDPTHVEAKGVTIASARNGARPTFNGQAAAPSPQPQPQPNPATPQPQSQPGPSPSVHIVKAGDTLGAIAKANGLTLAKLLALNPQFQANPNLIKVGQQVRLA